MDRINVSEEWRMHNTDSSFKIEFEETVDMIKAFEAMKNAIEEISYENGYSTLWLQDLRDCCSNGCFDIESTLSCDEFMDFIPAMVKAVAKTFPVVSFNGTAKREDLKCYWIDEFEFSFNGSKLHIKETFMDDNCG